MYITATGAFLPSNVPILLLVQGVQRAGWIGLNWAWPSVRSNIYLSTHCAVSLN